MQQLMPVLAKAMADATNDQPAQPVLYIANKLTEVRHSCGEHAQLCENLFGSLI